MPKVSIVVPIYGVEKYIQRCAESLFKQTLDDIEFIFVDDCTKDNSFDILEKVLDRFPNRKKYVRIIRHSINMGLPLARKSGIEAANGDYVINCDSDDWLDIDMVRQMYEVAVKEDSDIVLCDFAICSVNQLSTRKGCLDTRIEHVIKDMCLMRIPWSVCNKLFKRDLFSSSIEYPSDNMGEDMALTMQIIPSAKKISYIPTSLYYYSVNPNSITQTIETEAVIRNHEQYLCNLKLVQSQFHRMGLYDDYEKYFDILKFQCKRILWEAGRTKTVRTIWLNTFPELNKRILFNSGISYKERIKYYLCLMNLYPR